MMSSSPLKGRSKDAALTDWPGKFPESNVSSPDDLMLSGGHGGHGGGGHSRLGGRSQCSSSLSDRDITEENFESYGDNDDVEYER